jgi:hypothetical protein
MDTDFDNQFVEALVSIAFQSDEMSSEEMTRVLQLQPKRTRCRGLPAGSDKATLSFISAFRKPVTEYSYDFLERYISEQLSPFDGRREAMSQLQSRNVKFTISCSVRASRRILLMPFSLEVLRRIVDLGFSLNLTCGTRATFQNPPQEVA